MKQLLYTSLFVLTFTSCAHQSAEVATPRTPASVDVIEQEFDPLQAELQLYNSTGILVAGEQHSYPVLLKLKDVSGKPYRIHPSLIHVSGVQTKGQPFYSERAQGYVFDITSSQVKTANITIKVKTTLLKQQLEAHFVEPIEAKKIKFVLHKKEDGNRRTYLLTISDKKGRTIASADEPEILLEGDAHVSAVEPYSAGQWLVTMDFPAESSVNYVGMKMRGQTFRSIARVDFAAQEIDYSRTVLEPSKSGIRADGQETAIIKVKLRNPQGGGVFEWEPFSLALTSDQAQSVVEGPFDGQGGAFFKVKSTQAGPHVLTLAIDGLQAGQVTLNVHPHQPKAFPQDYVDCLKNIQNRTRVTNGLPFGVNGALVFGPFALYRAFPVDESVVWLFHQEKAYQLTYPELGMYAPGGDLEADTLKFKLDAETFYIQKDIAGSIGVAWDLQKNQLNKKGSQIAFHQGAFDWYTRKLKTKTGKDHLVAQPLDIAPIQERLETFFIENTDKIIQDLTYSVRDEGINDAILLQPILDLLSHSACVQLPALDEKREEWGTKLRTQARIR